MAGLIIINRSPQKRLRPARGFRNFVYFRTAAYHRAGQLNLDVPNMSKSGTLSRIDNP
jgi:hypothetical protein